MNRDFGTVALLPMKAHSSRVPGKNFRKFAGKPLFWWILDTLLKIDSIDTIVINTDARAILAENGLVETDRILIRDRKEELCGDMVSMNHVLRDDLEAIAAQTYVMTHTTNPLLGSATIDSALREYQRVVSAQTHDSLFSVNQHQTRFYRQDGSAINHDPNNLVRTQDLEPWCEENSNLYIFSRSSFEATSARIGKKPLLFGTPVIESFDIDDEDGWQLAELIAEHFRRAMQEKSSTDHQSEPRHES